MPGSSASFAIGGDGRRIGGQRRVGGGRGGRDRVVRVEQRAAGHREVQAGAAAVAAAVAEAAAEPERRGAVQVEELLVGRGRVVELILLRLLLVLVLLVLLLLLLVVKRLIHRRRAIG